MSRKDKKVATQFTQNQNNMMSDDPKDGSRGSFILGRDGRRTAAEKPPEDDSQDQSRIESLGRQGAGAKSEE